MSVELQQKYDEAMDDSEIGHYIRAAPQILY
jgi:hypothetical protein